MPGYAGAYLTVRVGIKPRFPWIIVFIGLFLLSGYEFGALSQRLRLNSLGALARWGR